MNVSEEIEIGLDASNALRGLSQLGSNWEKLARSAGISDREITRSLNHMEKGIATVNAAVAKQAASHRQNTGAIREETRANEQLAQAQKRAQEKTGLRQNSAGQTIDSSGKFVSADRSRQLQNEIQLQQKLIDMAPQLERLRSINAQKAFAAEQKVTQAAREQTAAYQNRQAVLEKAFRSNVVGLAAPDATRWEKFGNVLRQIPPVTWTRSLNDANAKFMDLGNSARYALYDVSATFGVAGAAVAGLGTLAITSAIKHERAFANVARTTQTTEIGYEQLRRQLELMSMEIPVSFEGLTEIATAAAQLGISSSGVSTFTAIVAKLSATTNLTADAAGIALARFRAFFSTAEEAGMEVTEATFSNLASSILKVGVNSIASETGIVNVATQIASMGDYAGLSANQVIGLAGALSSIGVAPELSRGTITRTFSLIGIAVSEGGDKLDRFAKLSGRSAKEFHDAWGTNDFGNVFIDLVGGIKNLSDSGQDANLALMELGFNSVRDRPLLLRLAEAADEAGVSGGLLAQTMRDAEAGWRENSELALQYSKIANTASSRIQILGQTFEQLAASMGAESGTFLGEIAKNLTVVVKGFEELTTTDVGKVFSTAAVQGALLVGGLMLMVAASARLVASMQGIGQAAKIMADVSETSLERIGGGFRILSLSLGIVGILGAIAGVVGGFIAMQGASEKANMAIQDTNGLVQAMATDAANGADGITFYAKTTKELTAEQEGAAAQAEGMTKALYNVKGGADSGADAVSNMADETEKAKYVFGDAAKEFYRSSLLQSEAFQSLFDPNKQFSSSEFSNFMGQGLTLDQLGITPDMLDWGKLMEQSIEGTIDRNQIYRQLIESTGIEEFDTQGRITKEAAAISNYANIAASAFGDVKGNVQGVIDSTSALSATSKQAFDDYTEGAITATEAVSKMDEETAKALKKVAEGFAKFTDIGGIMKITQQQITGTAEEYEKAWTEAYGGASFSLDQFNANFQRAGDEQQQFILNLQKLSSVGVDPAILNDLAEMGPEANRLVQAMVDDINTTGGAGLQKFEDLWGRTGYDAALAFAVQAQLGQIVINNIMQTGGEDALRAFNAALSTGIGTEEALASIQRDVSGKPIKPVIAKPDAPPGLTEWEKQQWTNNNRLALAIDPYLTKQTILASGAASGRDRVNIGMFASGGYTGSGGKYDPAGIVHKDEFVMNKEATRAIGVGNLYAMMNAASGGRSAPRGRGGYAQGGLVSGGTEAAGYIASFGPMAVQQMMAAFRQYINLDGKAISDNSAAQYQRENSLGGY